MAEILDRYCLIVFDTDNPVQIRSLVAASPEAAAARITKASPGAIALVVPFYGLHPFLCADEGEMKDKNPSGVRRWFRTERPKLPPVEQAKWAVVQRKGKKVLSNLEKSGQLGEFLDMFEGQGPTPGDD